jgi:hypothetical protein
MTKFCKFALLAAVAGVLSVPAATPSYAHWTHHHYRHHVGVHHGYGAYAYVPRRHWSANSRNERNCMRSPSSLRYKPCFNRP